MNKYMKIEKRNGKRKKKRGFLLTGPGGIFGPAERRRARAGGPAGHQRGSARGRRCERGPTRQREEGGNGVGGKAVCGDENRSLVKFRGGSSSVTWFCID
jgi:hypothetical protein